MPPSRTCPQAFAAFRASTYRCCHSAWSVSMRSGRWEPTEFSRHTCRTAAEPAEHGETLNQLVEQIAARGKGVVMTMGKGGVGKTTLAVRIATQLARAGHHVMLTTTDPAAHVDAAARERPATLHVTRIDPAAETRRYTEEVLATAGQGLDAQGRALLEEDLRSPCTEEIAVRAFADTVAQGEDQFVVIDTAPTGHTLLLLDAAEAYHREVLRKASGTSDAVQRLLPRLRDPQFTMVLLVTLPEATRFTRRCSSNVIWRAPISRRSRGSSTRA